MCFKLYCPYIYYYKYLTSFLKVLVYYITYSLSSIKLSLSYKYIIRSIRYREIDLSRLRLI
jgi:hypothetical protein